MTRCQRACELLRPSGQLAFWSATHVVPDGSMSEGVIFEC
jgi:hypothetical protein